MRRLLLLSLVISLVHATNGRTDAAGENNPPLREAVAVRAVDVLLLAQDAVGVAVEDLEAEDLRVEWKGEPLLFRLGRAAEDHDVSSGVPQVRLGLQVGSDETVALAAPDPPRHYVFFIDLTADLDAKPAEAGAPLLQFVRETLRTQDFAAVAVYNGSFTFETGFTSDIALIEAAIERAYARARRSISNTRQRIRSLMARVELCDLLTADSVFMSEEEQRMERSASFGSLSADPDCIRGLAESYITEGAHRAETFFRAMEQAIRFSGGIRGGMTLMALTHGVSLEPEREFIEVVTGALGAGPVNEMRDSLSTGERARDALGRVRRLAASERVTIYSVDSARRPRGVKGAGQASMSLDGASPMELAFQLSTAPLAELAEATVGAYVYDEHLLAGLRRAESLDRGRYRLQVYVPDDAGGEVASKLTIRPAARGLRLTFNLDFSVGDRENTVATQLTFGPARALPADDRANVYLPFTLGARPSELDYQVVGGNRVADLSLYVRVDTPDGSHVVSAYRAFRHTLPVERWEEQKDQLLGIRGWLEAPPGSYRVFAIFRNAGSGKEGLVKRNIRVEDSGS